MLSIEQLTKKVKDAFSAGEKPADAVKAELRDIGTLSLCGYVIGELRQGAELREAVEDRITKNVVKMTNEAAFIEMINDIRNGGDPEKYPDGTRYIIPDVLTGKDTVWVISRRYSPLTGERLDNHLYLLSDGVVSNESGDAVRIPFDEKEALYYASEGLPAGNYRYKYDGSTYSFTLTKDIPAGGQIVHNALTDSKLMTYESPEAREPIEAVNVWKKVSGKLLGEVMYGASACGNMNCMSRVWYGSNNYEQSDVRNYLTEQEWKPASIFDRPPEFAGNDCLAKHLPQYFIDAIIPTDISCRTNRVFENRSIDGTTFEKDEKYTVCDKFFIPSYSEVKEGSDKQEEAGGLFSLFSDVDMTARIKRDVSGNRRWYWLRSPGPLWAVDVRAVGTDGDADYYDYAYDPGAVAPACRIL